MKLTSIDDLTDEIIGKRGIVERERFEYDLRMDVLGTMIKDVRIKQNMTQGDLRELDNTKGIGSKSELGERLKK